MSYITVKLSEESPSEGQKYRSNHPQVFYCKAVLIIFTTLLRREYLVNFGKFFITAFSQSTTNGISDKCFRRQRQFKPNLQLHRYNFKKEQTPSDNFLHIFLIVSEHVLKHCNNINDLHEDLLFLTSSQYFLTLSLKTGLEPKDQGVYHCCHHLFIVGTLPL